MTNAQIAPWAHTQSSMTDIRISWQNAQIAPRAQKKSLQGAQRCTYWILGLVSLSRCIFLFSCGKAEVGSQCRAGEKQGGTPNQMILATLRSGPPKPVLESSSTQPGSSSGSSTWKTLWSQISREHSATLARKTITIGKWV